MGQSALTVPFVFLQGLLSFLLPCVLPLLPAWLATMTGGTIASLHGDGRFNRTLFLHTLMFVLGFSAVFVALGASATALGKLLLKYGEALRYASGVLVVLMGILTMELFHLPFLQREKRFDAAKGAPGLWRSLLLGIAFGFGWTPCIGPVLASVLLLAANTRSLWQGGLLLLVYALGMGLPFLALSVFFGALSKPLRFLGKYSLIIKRVAGVLLVALGILILTGSLQWFATL